MVTLNIKLVLSRAQPSSIQKTCENQFSQGNFDTHEDSSWPVRGYHHSTVPLWVHLAGVALQLIQKYSAAIPIWPTKVAAKN